MMIKKQQGFTEIGSLLTVALIGVAGYAAVAHFYDISDWIKLRNYAPPANVAQLADQTTMTDKSRHMFYLNHPGVEDKATFRANCDKFGEQTIVLGCYLSGQQGIHVLAVNDERLQGVEQVTAAHEMLHAAYDRLSSKNKAVVDAMLQDYADHQLKDTRIIETLNSYKKTEPGQQLNEMHSIFGTEIADLPSGLQTYYNQYFTNRKQITDYAATYQAAFTSRQDAITAYDNQLKQLNIQVKANSASLASQQKQLETSGQRLDALRANGDLSRYNAGVPTYNAGIETYNQLLDRVKSQIAQYNQIVVARNAIATETADLQQAIDSSKLPASK